MLIKKSKRKLKKDNITRRSLSQVFRIVIPNLKEYQNKTNSELLSLKRDVFQKLKFHPNHNLKSEFERGLEYYSIAIETHKNDIPHLDILLVYRKKIRRRFTDFDYLLKHGNITTYRQLNHAILRYNFKEDLFSISNFKDDMMNIKKIIQFKADPFRFLELAMLQDPLNFELEHYLRSNDYYQYITNGYSIIKTKLKDSQNAAANLVLYSKPGIKYITRTIIEQNLTKNELFLYDSWIGFQEIVDTINTIVEYGSYRPLKTLNLLITGLPNCGKTALIHNPHHKGIANPLEDYISIYPMGMANWFPVYKSGIYSCIFWNEAKLTSYSYDTILKLLEGSYLDLPTKGGSSQKIDNPCIIMTSNLTLEEMIDQKFPKSLKFRKMAHQNLNVRLKNVIVPKHLNLFILQKLFLKKD